MLPIVHQLQNLPEFQKIEPLLRFQQMLFEERNDLFIEVFQTSHPICHPLAMILANYATPEELLEGVKQLDVSLMLDHCEFREYLKPGGHLRVRIDADKETTFAIHESDHPLSLQPSRLRLNVKSLRVLHAVFHLEPSLRIVPLSVGF